MNASPPNKTVLYPIMTATVVFFILMLMATWLHSPSHYVKASYAVQQTPSAGLLQVKTVDYARLMRIEQALECDAFRAVTTINSKQWQHEQLKETVPAALQPLITEQDKNLAQLIEARFEPSQRLIEVHTKKPDPEQAGLLINHMVNQYNLQQHNQALTVLNAFPEEKQVLMVGRAAEQFCLTPVTPIEDEGSTANLTMALSTAISLILAILAGWLMQRKLRSAPTY